MSIEQMIPVYAPSTDGNNVSLSTSIQWLTLSINGMALAPASGHHTPNRTGECHNQTEHCRRAAHEKVERDC